MSLHLLMLDWLRAPALCWQVQAKLNKGEVRNALARAIPTLFG